MRERKEEKQRERHCIGGRGVRSYISGFEGSQAVPARPSGRGNAYDRNYFLMTLEGLHVKHAVQRGILDTNSANALRSRKTTENLDRVGRSQELPHAD
jgi:hypothetical protein